MNNFISGKYSLFIIKLLISLSVIFLLLVNIDFKVIYNIILKQPLHLFLFIIFISYLQVALNALIQHQILLIFNFRLGLWDIYKHNFISTLFLFVIPAFFAPDLYLSVYYGKKFKNFQKIIIGLLFNRIIGFIIFFCFSVLALIFMKDNILKLSDNIRINFRMSIVYIIIILGSITLSLFFLRKIIKKIVKGIKEKYNIIKKDFIANIKKVSFIFLLKIFYYLFSIFVRALIAKILGINIPILYLVGIIILVNFLVVLPISINGIGIREIGYIGLMHIFNIDMHLALTVSILDFSIIVIAAITGGIIFIIHPIKLNRLNEANI